MVKSEDKNKIIQYEVQYQRYRTIGISHVGCMKSNTLNMESSIQDTHS